MEQVVEHEKGRKKCFWVPEPFVPVLLLHLKDWGSLNPEFSFFLSVVSHSLGDPFSGTDFLSSGTILSSPGPFLPAILLTSQVKNVDRSE